MVLHHVVLQLLDLLQDQHLDIAIPTVFAYGEVERLWCTRAEMFARIEVVGFVDSVV